MFKTPLQVEKIGTNNWKLLAPLLYDDEKNNIRYLIPVGFTTNFANVPWWLWWFCPPVAGDHAEPSVLHDYLCVTIEKDDLDSTRRIDKIFLEAMKSCKVEKTKRTIMYTGVRLYRKGKYVRKLVLNFKRK